ncbi:MAG: PorT family protein [Prevotellaceae bacterium]|jgi:hypothetical protein|nr:PorT family protein [Prevotellaceae bacterium]
MKRTIHLLWVALLMAVATGASAQLKVGVKAGMNLASLSELQIGDHAAGLDEKVGLHAGVLVQYVTPSRFGLETGLYYNMLGGEERERDYDEDYKISATSHYLQLPVQLIYQFRLGDDLRLTPAAGLYGAYGLGGKVKASGSVRNTSIEIPSTDFFNDATNRFDMGVTVGLNLEYERFLVGVGYEHGFLKLNKHPLVFEDDNSYNENIKVSIGILF